MGGWMDALADKVHKQGEHIPQHCYISHNHLYICSSTATYVGMVECRDGWMDGCMHWLTVLLM